MFQLAGWGITENKTPSDVLLHVDLPYIDYDHCIDKSSPEFWDIRSNKFCVGFNNGKLSTYFKFRLVILCLGNTISRIFLQVMFNI